MNRTLKFQRVLLITLVLQFVIALFAIKAWSQTLDEKYNSLIDKSETYDKYKVISKTKLDGLWSDLQLELAASQRSISELRQSIAQAKNANDSLIASINTVSRKLNESQASNGLIAFLGIDIEHGVYHSIVWSIVGILLGGLVYFGARFKISGRVVDQLILEKEALSSEFEDHKFNSHQRMLKTKRELQTALNKLEELKVH